jgi:hypothetical protein
MRKKKRTTGKTQRPNEWARRWVAWHAADMLRDADKFYAAAEDDRNSAKERRWAMKEAADLRIGAQQFITSTDVLRLAVKALNAMERGEAPRDFIGENRKRYNDKLEEAWKMTVFPTATGKNLCIDFNPTFAKWKKNVARLRHVAADSSLRRTAKRRNYKFKAGKSGRPKKTPRLKAE